MIAIGAIEEFINYAILGITTFTNKISYRDLLENDKIEINILAVLIPISIIANIIIILVRKILNKENETSLKNLTIFIYSFSIIILMYPIADEIHFLIATLIAVINMLYLFGLLGKTIYNKIKYKKKYKLYKIITLIVWIALFYIILATSINNLYKYIKAEKNTEIAHYKNLQIEEYLVTRIHEVNEYIKEKEQEGKKVYILDVEAPVSMIAADKYNKDYDMFLIGNIGKDGQEGQIEKIKQRDENIVYLIRRKPIKQNWQAPTEVIDYIRENLKLVEKINMYEVYE